MPINYQGKDYSFQGLEKKIKKSKPGIKSPGGYVHTIEERQHKAQELKTRLQRIAGEGHDNATRGATDEEQKAIDFKRKKEAEKRRLAYPENLKIREDYDPRTSQLKARLQKLAETQWETCEECGKDFPGKEELDKHYKAEHE
jgi:hypothetical protein